jgi:hypothetical protein
MLRLIDRSAEYDGDETSGRDPERREHGMTGLVRRPHGG